MPSVQSNESGPFPLSNALYTATPIKIKQKNGKGKTHLKKGNAIEQQWSSSMFDIQILFRAFQNRKKKVVIYREDTLIYWLQMLLDLQNWCFCR
jgi:hypothetical protein